MGLYCCLSTVNSYVQNLKWDDFRTIPVRVRHSVYELQFLGLWLQGPFFALELAQNLRHLDLNAGSICNPDKLNWTASLATRFLLELRADDLQRVEFFTRQGLRWGRSCSSVHQWWQVGHQDVVQGKMCFDFFGLENSQKLMVYYWKRHIIQHSFLIGEFGGEHQVLDPSQHGKGLASRRAGGCTVSIVIS
jgi:hypothetical protein